MRTSCKVWFSRLLGVSIMRKITIQLRQKVLNHRAALSYRTARFCILLTILPVFQDDNQIKTLMKISAAIQNNGMTVEVTRAVRQVAHDPGADVVGTASSDADADVLAARPPRLGRSKLRHDAATRPAPFISAPAPPSTPPQWGDLRRRRSSTTGPSRALAKVEQVRGAEQHAYSSPRPHTPDQVYRLFTIPSYFPEELLKFFFQDIHPPHGFRKVGSNREWTIKRNPGLRKKYILQTRTSWYLQEITHAFTIILEPCDIEESGVFGLLYLIAYYPGTGETTMGACTVPGGVVVRVLTSHLGKPGSIPDGFAPGFSHVGIVPDDAAGWRVFSEISRFHHPFLPTLLHSNLSSPSSAHNISLLRAAQISPFHWLPSFATALTANTTVTITSEHADLRTALTAQPQASGIHELSVEVWAGFGVFRTDHTPSIDGRAVPPLGLPIVDYYYYYYNCYGYLPTRPAPYNARLVVSDNATPDLLQLRLFPAKFEEYHWMNVETFANILKAIYNDLAECQKQAPTLPRAAGHRAAGEGSSARGQYFRCPPAIWRLRDSRAHGPRSWPASSPRHRGSDAAAHPPCMQPRKFPTTESEPGSIPGRATPGFSQVVPDDAAVRRVFSGISRFPCNYIPTPLHLTSLHPHCLSKNRPHLFTHSLIRSTLELIPEWCRQKVDVLQLRKIHDVTPVQQSIVWPIQFIYDGGEASIVIQQAVVSQRLDCSPPKTYRVQSPAGSLWVFASRNRAGRCRWYAGFLGDIPFPPPLHSGGTAPFSPHLTFIGSQDPVVKSCPNLSRKAIRKHRGSELRYRHA
ncbi:hypothetical protein PR048_003055 [Dryococelus australis]|uniref:Uncharacterized protein n=1 Tax=Dryococelus australis TaxID=614101 RepID=A0ABQ9ILY5_9NEOP|nr:hypothetical protein PR048_003055 [Dryococelus australis]